MTIRVAAVGVSHWHAVYDAAYLRHLGAMPDVELVGVQDPEVWQDRVSLLGEDPADALADQFGL